MRLIIPGWISTAISNRRWTFHKLLCRNGATTFKNSPLGFHAANTFSECRARKMAWARWNIYSRQKTRKGCSRAFRFPSQVDSCHFLFVAFPPPPSTPKIWDGPKFWRRWLVIAETVVSPWQRLHLSEDPFWIVMANIIMTGFFVSQYYFPCKRLSPTSNVSQRIAIWVGLKTFFAIFVLLINLCECFFCWFLSMVTDSDRRSRMEMTDHRCWQSVAKMTDRRCWRSVSSVDGRSPMLKIDICERGE